MDAGYVEAEEEFSHLVKRLLAGCDLREHVLKTLCGHLDCIEDVWKTTMRLERLVERLNRVDIAPSSLVANRRTEAFRRRELCRIFVSSHHMPVFAAPYSSVYSRLKTAWKDAF